MAVPVIMPRQGQSVESCIISEWCKKVGDTVKVGDTLFNYETDKASFSCDAEAEGTILAEFFKADDDVPCLTNVAVIGAPGEDFSAFKPATGAEPLPAESAAPAEEKKAEAAPAAAPAAAPEAAPAAGASGFVSPRARTTAERDGVDASQAAGTGPHGRVIERDVIALAARRGEAPAEAAAAAPAAAAPAASAAPAAAFDAMEYEEKKLSNVRKIIGKAMHQSLSEMAQLTHSTSFDATQLMAFRAGLKNAPESMGLPKITVNDLMLFAVSRVLPQFPALNAHLVDDKMRYFKHCNLGIAVDTPRGLLVPTLFAADTKSIAQIASESRELIKAAQEGSISPDLLQGATTTVSNVGMMGIESFTPVVNPPQTAILGVCCVTQRVRVVDGAITTYPAMGLSLTYDHRALDGADASRYLKALVEALENFSALAAK